MKTAEIKFQDGKPTLYVDGVMTPPLFYALSDIPASRAWTDQAARNIKNFADCGINIVCVDTCLHYGMAPNSPYDPSEPLREVRAALRANEGAAVIIRLHLNPPYEWMLNNPDETYGYYGVSPTVRDGYGDRLIANDDRTELRVSLASEKWLRDCGEALNALCDALKADACGQSVIGLHLACGLYGEWHPWGFFDFDGDYSPAMEKFFRKLLKEKYGTDQALRAAWKDDTVTIDSAPLPPPTRRDLARDGRYRYPETDMRVIDAFTAGQKAITAAIAHFARITKSALPHTLVGVFYGYFFNTSWANNKAAHGGCHIEVQDILLSPDVDYIAAPFCYTATRNVGNALRLRSLLESARLNGKLCLCEMDQAPMGSDKAIGGVPELRTESVALLKRNILGGLMRGMGGWYYDHRLVPGGSIYEKNGWWDHPELLCEISKLTDVAKALMHRKYVKMCEVLVVCDTERLYYVADNAMTNDDAEFAFHDALGKSGAGYDAVYLSDLFKVDLSTYKAVVFVDCVKMNKDVYDYVQSTVCADRTVVFIGDNGFIRGNAHDKALHRALTADDGTEYCETVHGNTRIIHSQKLITDRKYWRELLISAGVHVYTDNGEVVAADNGCVLIHGTNIPSTAVHLRDKTITVENPRAFTYLYDASTGEKLL